MKSGWNTSSPFLPILEAAEVIHVGKGTSCGNGRISIVKDFDP